MLYTCKGYKPSSEIKIFFCNVKQKVLNNGKRLKLQRMIPVYAGAQWLRGRVLEPHRRHCVVSLSKNINPSLVLVQPRNTRPFITEKLLMGRKETNKQNPFMPHFCVPL